MKLELNGIEIRVDELPNGFKAIAQDIKSKAIRFESDIKDLYCVALKDAEILFNKVITETFS